MRVAVPEIGHNNPPSEMEILQERLRDNYQDIADEAKRLASKEIPETINDELEAGKLTDYVRAVKALISKVGEVHKAEKKIYLDCGDVVQQWKNTYERDLNALINSATAPIQVFLKKKEDEEAERLRVIAQKAREDAEKLQAEAVAHEEAGIQDTAGDLMEAAVEAEDYAAMVNNSANELRVKARSVHGSSATSAKKWVGEIISKADIDLEALRPYFTPDAIQKALEAGIRSGLRECKGAKISQQSKINFR